MFILASIMKSIFTWFVRIAVLLLIIKVVMWSWEQYQRGGKDGPSAPVQDFDKVCRITNPDLGSCVCLHRQTNERLSLPYEECVERARNPD